LSFNEHASEFAKNCQRCHGRTYLLENGKYVVCQCQLQAQIQHRREQIPKDFRYLKWLDYTGDTVIGNGKHVHVINWQESRNTAFRYCFSKKPINKIVDGGKLLPNKEDNKVIEDTIEKRISKSKILKRKEEGANLAIFGVEATGKTLIAALIAQEIIYASVLLGDFDFKWLSFNTLINSISFNRVNYELIDEVSYVDFLVLDNVYIPQQGNYMKNILDEIFYDRLMNKMPTILTAEAGTENSEHFKKKDQYSGTTARQAVGDEFYRLLNSSNTQKIVLKISQI